MSQNRDIEAIYPLSPAQEGMLFHSLYAPQSGVYVVQASYALRGDLNTQALRQAWQQTINRHSILRTFFVWERREKPLQIARAHADAPWSEHDWRALNEIEQAVKLEELLRADCNQGFDLSNAPLMRLALCRLGDDKYQLIWSIHHILLDGWSLQLLLQEVVAYYTAYSQGHDLQLPSRRPYRDYINWLRQQELSQAETFWREMLRGFTVPSALAMDRVRSDAHDENPLYEEQTLRLSEAATSALTDVAQRNALTMNTLAQGAYALLLSHYSGAHDVVFGIVSSGRPAALEGVESMIGLFINTLPMRVLVTPDDYLVPWLQKLQERQAEIRRHEYSPLVQVRAWSEMPKDIELFESLFVFENYPALGNSNGRENGLEIGDVHVAERANYPLSLIIGPGAQLHLRAIYSSRSFDADTIARLLRHYETLLLQIAARPEQPLSRFSILTRAERDQILLEWNDTVVDCPPGLTIHGLFEAQVARTPNDVAVLFEDQYLLYGDLDRRANQLARHLRKFGVGPEVQIGVFMERSIELVVSLLAVLKAGGAYIPLDPEYPSQRLALMLEDAQVPALLTQQRLRSQLPPHQAQVVCVDSEWQTIASESAERLNSEVMAENAAYVIYTSGSTGTPKGVVVTHSNLVHSTLARTSYYREPVGKFLLLSSVAFDSSVAGIFWTLTTGGALVLPPERSVPDAELQAALIAKHGVTHLLALPALYRLILENAQPNQLSSLRTAIAAGEACTDEVVNCGRTVTPQSLLFNEYGPTEATVWSSVFDCSAESDLPHVPIGRPIANTQIYLLTNGMQPVPVGVSGELYLGGAGLARGYLKRPDLTAEKFIPNPFAGEPGGRLYRTGDLARYRPDGAIEFIGRADHQVKLRGFRIELSEIEAVLEQHAGVHEAVVIVREDESDDKSLVAYLTPQLQGGITTAELREFLREKLPHYMIPAAFMELNELPLMPNGKVDRRALPAVESQSQKSDGAFTAPRTEIEQTIATAWQEVLHVDAVGVHDNFFDLGGHSLRMIQLRSKLQELLQTDVSMNDLFRNPTVNSMAAFFSRDTAQPDSVAGNDGRVGKLREGKNRLQQRARQKQQTA